MSVLCYDGISGTIGTLVVDDTFESESSIFPNNRRAFDLTIIGLYDSKFGPKKICNNYKYSYSYISYVVLYSNFLRNRLYQK